MPLIASEGDSKPKQLPPTGTHIARCISVIDLGTQSTPFGDSHKIRLTWELPEEKAVFKEDAGEQPFLISRDYTLSLFEKANLRHDLESWRGKQFTAEELAGFDIFTLLGVPCLLTVIHKTNDKGKTFANINGVSTLAKGMKCPAQITPSVSYSISNGQSTVYQSLPEWLRKKISEAQEWGREEDDMGETPPAPGDPDYIAPEDRTHGDEKW